MKNEFYENCGFWSVFCIGACSVLESLGTGLGRLAEELEGQPIMYVGRQIDVDFGTRHLIDAVTVVRGREGTAEDVLYEGSRREFGRIENAEWPGAFSQLSLRNDGQRLAGVLEENIIDTDEFHALIYSVPDGRRIKSVKDEIIAADGFELCFDPQDLEHLAGIDRSVQARIFDPKFPDEIYDDYEVTFDYLFSGGPLQEWVVTFLGWTRGGRPVFQSDYHVTIIVSVAGFRDDLLFDLDEITSESPNTGVVYSAETGERIACFENQRLRPSSERAFEVLTREVRGVNDPEFIATRFTIAPPGGGRFTLFSFPSSTTANPLFFKDRVTAIATPAAP